MLRLSPRASRSLGHSETPLSTQKYAATVSALEFSLAVRFSLGPDSHACSYNPIEMTAKESGDNNKSELPEAGEGLPAGRPGKDEE